MRLYFYLLSFIFCFNLRAQEGIPVFFDYLTEHYYVVHPSLAGVNTEGTKFRMTSRKQWFDVENAPSVETFAVDSRISERSGIGAMFFNDKAGHSYQRGFSLTYAHHINFNTRNSRVSRPGLSNSGSVNQLSFGLSLGRVSYGYNLPSTGLGTQGGVGTSGLENGLDPNKDVGYFNFETGISYVNFNYYVHLTLKNLLFKPDEIFGEEYIAANNVIPVDGATNALSHNLFDFGKGILSAGYLIFTEGRLSFEPSILYMRDFLTSQSSIDLNFKGYYDLEYDQIWFGIATRNSLDGADSDPSINSIYTGQKLSIISPFVGINYRNFVFSYNYTFQLGDKVNYLPMGIHQFSLGYNLFVFN